MVEESQNSKKTIKHLRRGLSIYKTGRSPFWHARIYDAVKKKYVVRSTKETNRIEAAEVAEEIVETYKKKQNSSHAVSKDRSFEHYAKMLSEITKQKAKASNNKYAFIGCSSHSGRRTFITNAARKISSVGGSLRDVQALAGYSSLAVTQRYIDGSEDARAKVVELV